MNRVRHTLRSAAAWSSRTDEQPGPSAALSAALCLLVWFGVLFAAGLGLDALADTVASLDRRLASDAVTIRTAPLTTVAHLVSLLGRSWVLIALAAILGIIWSRRAGIRAWSPLLAVVGADALQNALKAVVNRPRPAVLHLEHVTSSSFPSGHATQSAAFLLALTALIGPARSIRWRTVATFTAAAVTCAVGTSRVYLGVHYPSDVVAGIILGAAWAAGVIRCFAPGSVAQPSSRRPCSGPSSRCERRETPGRPSRW